MDGKTYTFSLPTKLITGCGSLNMLGKVASLMGTKALLVSGKRAMRELGILDRAIQILYNEGITSIIFDQIEPEPSTETVNIGAKLAKEEGCEVIVGLGGGSAIDGAKAIAGIANKATGVEEYHSGKNLEFAGLPFIAIPTTSGTGAEVTPNAVLINKEQMVKQSFRDSHLFPKAAIIDPELTITLSPQITAYSGMDGLCQAIESFVSGGSNPITDGLAAWAIELIGRSLLRAYQNGSDLSARTDMAYGALLAGITLFNARMGVIHGIVHPLGVKYNLSHGLLCGMLLSYGMEFNLKVASKKYSNVAKLLGIDDECPRETESAKKAISRIRTLLAELNFPKGLRELGVKSQDFPSIARDSMNSGSLKANPKKVTEEDVVEILNKAL